MPEAHLAWKPHDKSSSLGQLAFDVASLPQQLTGFVTGDTLDVTTVDIHQQAPTSLDEVMATFDESLNSARMYLTSLEDARAGEIWRLVAGRHELFAAPRAAVIRSFLFNHLYHRIPSGRPYF